MSYSLAADIGKTLDDENTLPPVKKYFEDWTFEPVTRTFKGVHTWFPLTFNQNKACEYTMVFDEKFSEILRGFVKIFKNTGKKVKAYYGRDLVYKFH